MKFPKGEVLGCGCCGGSFVVTDPERNDYDIEGNVCPSCEDWIWDSHTKPRLLDAAAKLEAALNEENAAKMRSFSEQKRMAIAMKAIEDGVFQWEIKSA